jgi:hypothetical protein
LPGTAWLDQALTRHVGKRREAAASVMPGEDMSKNADLHKRRVAAVPRGVGNSLAVYAERAQNSELWDGRGSALRRLRERHRRAQYRATCIRTSRPRWPRNSTNSPHGCSRYAVRELTSRSPKPHELAPGPAPKKTDLSSRPGAEAVENAIKIARYATKRSGVIAFTGRISRPARWRASRSRAKVQPYKSGLRADAAECFTCPFPMATTA